MTVTPEQATQAEAIRETAGQRYQALRDNTLLSNAALQVNLARIYVAAKAKMAAVQESDSVGTEARARALRARLFGVDGLASTPADRAALAISSRDAQDRAGALQSTRAAADLLSRAVDTGDQILARAIAGRAFTETRNPMNFGTDWLDVLVAYTERYPNTVDDFNELTDLLSQPTTVMTLFAYVLPAPPELAGLTDGRLTALVASSIPNAAPVPWTFHAGTV